MLALRDRGINAVGYYGKMREYEKRESFTSWKNGTTPVIVATRAFGLSINKSNVRFVIRNGLPPSISAWAQELGRAGRDGEQAQAHIFYSIDSVAELLANLDASKSTGVDAISARMLKTCAHSIAPSLTKLLNLSLSTGTLPSEWKTGRIVPIPKTDRPSSSAGDYRPISILPIVSKVLERHVKSLIDDYMTENAPISKHQWGFMSSTAALISVIHDWLCALDSGKEVCVVFFDVRKAFDSVPHIPLLQKLEDAGLDPFLLRWIRGYLTDRQQSTVVDGYSSTLLQVLSGVPQGSVLGPLLFIIYINDVVNCILHDSNINLFADDIALYRIINAPDDFAGLQLDIDAISYRLKSKYLDLNPSKCCFLMLTRKRSLSITPPTLMLNGNSLKRVYEYKYLGVLITSDLMWSSHITNICNKTRRLVGVLYRRFYKHSSTDTLLNLYVSFVRPHLEYAGVAWDPYLKKDIAAIEDVQKFALRVCTKSWDSNYDQLLSQSHLPSLEARRRQAKLCNLYNITNELVHFPDAPVASRVLNYATRSSGERQIAAISSRSNQHFHSFFPSAINAWNSLPSEVQTLSNNTSFKRAVKSLIT